MGTAVLADRQLEEMAAAQTACDVENHISLTVETVAGISGHALSGQKTCRGGRLCLPGRKRCG